ATLSGAVAGAGVLVKNGAGALTLAGDASSAAGLVINSGTLSGDTARLPSAIANHGHLVLNQIAGGAFTGTLTGAAGVITKAGAGALSLPGAVSAAVLNLDAGTLVVPGGRVLGVAQFNNRGILRVGKAGGDTAAGTVTIAGNYTGAAGAQLFLDLNISGTSLSCDRLRIGGDVDGVTTVAFGSVVSRNPLPGDSFLPADIISWDGGAAAGAFVQAECSVIEFGGAQYTWRVNAAGTGGEWVADAISSAPAMLGADAVALIAGKAALASLGRRMRYERLENRPHTLELWLNNARRHDTITSSAYAGARVSTEGLQLGGDWGGGTTGDGFRALGLFYERAESRLRLPGGVAKTRSESDGGGLYYTERAGAWFTDVVLRYAMADYFVAVPERPEFTTKGETFGYSAEVGRLVTLPGKWILQPSVQVASQRMEIATTTDAFGRTYRVNDTDSIELRAGAGISRDFEWRPKKALTLYARAGCAHEFDGETELHVAGHINRRNSLGGDAALLDAGAFMRVSNHLGASAEAAFWTGNRMRGFSLDLSLSCAW
ncbi:MAG: autotransporter outer membrane beta-barrel domain-containing protein, partial [Opitutaceae bacterium]|nr:autotransporter outer membrane beta-barrel domain-containing protein [Opitutaceae bacterium]